MIIKFSRFIYILVISIIFVLLIGCSSKDSNKEISTNNIVEQKEDIINTATEETVSYKKTDETQSIINSDENVLPTAPDIKKIIDKGYLEIAILNEDLPPCVMTKKNGELYGFDIELAQGIADSLGVEVKFNRSALSFNDMYEMVAHGHVDMVISKLSHTFKRAQHILYSRPYLNIKQSLLVNRLELISNKVDENNPLNYLNSKDATIGVLDNSSYEDWAKEVFPNANIRKYLTWESIVDDVIDGEITAAFYDDIEIMMIVKKNPDIILNVVIYVLKDRKDSISIGLHNDSIHLRQYVNSYLENFDINADVNTLMDKYPEVFQ